jgi:hypothetical protein
LVFAPALCAGFFRAAAARDDFGFVVGLALVFVFGPVFGLILGFTLALLPAAGLATGEAFF